MQRAKWVGKKKTEVHNMSEIDRRHENMKSYIDTNFALIFISG